MKKVISIIFLSLVLSNFLQGQTKMIYGQKHFFSVDIPENWIQSSHPQLAFFIKPQGKNISERTYIYAYVLITI